jgi:hypothetical protein
LTPEQLAAAKAEMCVRIHAACLTVRTLPADGPRGFYSTWPLYRHTWWDEGNEVSRLTAADITARFISPPRFYPTPKQIDDCLPALSLLDGLPRFARVVVSMRAHQKWYDLDGGWRSVGEKLNCAHKTARIAHDRAISHAFEAEILRSSQNSAKSLAA